MLEITRAVTKSALTELVCDIQTDTGWTDRKADFSVPHKLYPAEM